MIADVLEAVDAAADAILAAAAELGGDVEAVRRALSTEGRGRYGLGCGGRDPRAPDPFGAYQRRPGESAAVTRQRQALGRVWLDCSGALAWWWGEPRKDSADGEDEIAGDWLACDPLYADATGPRRFVRSVPAADVRPGDGLVYPGRWSGGRRMAIGHCALVIARPAVVTRLGDVAVMHCHGPSGQGPTVTRGTGALWDRHGGIALRRVGL